MVTVTGTAVASDGDRDKKSPHNVAIPSLPVIGIPPARSQGTMIRMCACAPPPVENAPAPITGNPPIGVRGVAAASFDHDQGRAVRTRRFVLSRECLRLSVLSTAPPPQPAPNAPF